MEGQDDTFEWLIGANTLDDDSLAAIAELKQTDKFKSHI
jgi:hypothetical protein